MSAEAFLAKLKRNGDYIDLDEVDSAESVFNRLVKRATYNADVISMAAPALSTEFVRSSLPKRAQAAQEGSFAEVIYPSNAEVDRRTAKKHPDTSIFGYTSTAHADAYPAGYGERSAKALARESNIYQLKGTFPAASLALAKLRARVEARSGDQESLNRVFSKLWGLTEDQTMQLPSLHVDGTESTRMAAMEDRAYHTLSGHPAYTGGFRVDTATLVPDALGENVPLNWPRIRTGLKAIAIVQIQADLEMNEMRMQLPKTQDFRFSMDMVIGSQPVYRRPYAWEFLLDKIIDIDPDDDNPYEALNREHDVAATMNQTFQESYIATLVNDPEIRIKTRVKRIADVVRRDSTKALERTIAVIQATEMERAMLDEELQTEFDDLDKSLMSQHFSIPRFKLTRSSLRVGVERTNLGRESLPDVRSHGLGSLRLKSEEFREAGFVTPLTLPGALNLAVYISANRQSAAVASYKLLALVKDPDPGGPGPVVSRLRNPALYFTPDVRALGTTLFGEDFMAVFETVFRNTTVKSEDTEKGVRDDLWAYLCGRTSKRMICPVRGGWRDLIAYLRDADHGWTLYYWARISIGKSHYAACNSILAPIAAGEEVDFMVLIRKSVREHALRWSARYTAKYQMILQKFKDSKVEAKSKEIDAEGQATNESINARKYVPPHLRQEAHLEMVYDADAILKREKGFSKEEYEHMVEMQVKAKFFAKIEAISMDRKLAVGIADDDMKEMLVEFYQARWYSLHKRIEHANSIGTVFKLGQWLLPTHPWGELNTELPTTLQGMLDFCTQLEKLAWTCPPDKLWMKLRKSLGELWGDVSREISEIHDYICEVTDCQADEQAEADATRRVKNVTASLSGIPAIVIPVPGYRIPSTLPDKVGFAYTQKGKVEVNLTANRMVHEPMPQPLECTNEEEDEYGGLDDDIEFTEFDDYTASKSQVLEAKEIPVYEGRYLTYNEIWNELDLRDAEDSVKRSTFGIAAETNLDSQHLDSISGPIVTYGERTKTRKMWHHKLGGMFKRLGQAREPVHEDDM